MNFKFIIRFVSIVLVAIMLVACGSSKKTLTKTPQLYPKREFRGAWIQTAWQSRYQQMNSAAMKHYIVEMVRKLDDAGINAVIFQIRPEADAFYKSDLEPWSRFLTGRQGVAPDDPTFDPLEFIIDECHKRGMELHAWMNPYRVKSSMMTELASNHLYWDEPYRFLEYNNQLFFDPGLPENRGFINAVVRDVVSRYDVDAIHMDDYFYPYPKAGESFPDDDSFNSYAASQGYAANQRDDWRRNNVNLLIQQVKLTIAGTKPWVRFGISPFGIYRNKRNTPDGSGSDTNGLQNYDDLYADIRLWVEKGWIDYNMPQVYWEIGHQAADYTTLANWWNANNFEQPLYIGQDLKRSLDKNELDEKIRQSRALSFVDGNCYWYGYLILENYADVSNTLASSTHRAKSLIPAYTHMHKGRPAKVKKLVDVFTEDMHFLTWESDMQSPSPESANYFVVYRFRKGEKVDINSATNIVKTTKDNFYVLPYENGKTNYTYVVTAVDSFHNESKVAKVKVKQ